jgi:hypothetical protein
MAKQPEFTKYMPLDDFFRKQPASKKSLKLTYEQVEKILGAPLPASASKSKNWWANFQPKIQSHRTTWLNHGWMVKDFNQEEKWVKFVRA